MIDEQIKEYVFNLCRNLPINDYTGIIVYGSYVGGRNDVLSDLDVMIIKENYDTQDCGSMMIQGVRVEYFIQDLKKLYELIKQQIDDNDPSHLTKFATCQILCDTDDKVAEFIRYAKRLYNTKIVPTFDDRDRFSIFSIHNRVEDLESLLQDDSFYSVYYVTLEKIRTLYSRINGIIELPVTKIAELYRNPVFAEKYISSEIHQLPNQEFIDLYLKCITPSDDRITMLSNIKEIYDYSFKDLEFDPNNFCLQFTNRSPFKV